MAFHRLQRVIVTDYTRVAISAVSFIAFVGTLGTLCAFRVRSNSANSLLVNTETKMKADCAKLK